MFQSIIANLQEDNNSRPGWKLRGDVLYYKDKLAVPRASSMVPIIMREYHNSPVGGHGGFLRTFKRIFNEFFWVGMRRDIKQFVATCDVCQRNKYETLSPAGLLQ